jgi:hypothetical protein
MPTQHATREQAGEAEAYRPLFAHCAVGRRSNEPLKLCGRTRAPRTLRSTDTCCSPRLRGSSPTLRLRPLPRWSIGRSPCKAPRRYASTQPIAPGGPRPTRGHRRLSRNAAVAACPTNSSGLPRDPPAVSLRPEGPRTQERPEGTRHGTGSTVYARAPFFRTVLTARVKPVCARRNGGRREPFARNLAAETEGVHITRGSPRRHQNPTTLHDSVP